MSDGAGLWNNFKGSYFHDAELGFSLDVSRVKFGNGFLDGMKTKADQALAMMNELEKGALSNPDEKRMVGHYWLRNPGLAPSSEIKSEIEQTLSRMKDFAARVHSGKVSSPSGEKYESVLVVGIGGSALGPQFVTRALNSAADPLRAYFFDNTDPDGMSMALSSIPSLARTLCIVISKSGGTKETRNGMLIAKHAWEKAGLKFEAHAIAVTSDGSELDKYATSNKWLERFPMWDWVGGRTSELSAVGLLAAALQGFNIDRMLEGARDMDEITRNKDLKRNPALLMASAWYSLGEGKGSKDMVVLPYNDRLELFSRYLQQLLMESLGKEHDLQGKVVNQGIAVYGNKGSTDQHAYVQQLRDGLLNFFVVFIQVLKDSSEKTALSSKSGAIPQGFDASKFEVEQGITSGDYLSGFYQGTRRALFEKGRQSITITLDEVNEYSVGALIALFERSVGLYASFININAYHQPGVEAGKKAASEVLTLQKDLVQYLSKQSSPQTVEEIAQGVGKAGETESLFLIARHLGANGKVKIEPGSSIFQDRYSRA